MTVRHKKLLFRELYYYEIVLEKEQSFYKISSGRFALRQRSSEPACPQFSCKPFDALPVAVDAVADDRVLRNERHVGVVSEGLAGGDVGDVHLHRRNCGRLEGVENCDARVRVGGGVHHDAVDAVEPRLLDAVDDGALMVGLEKFA